MRTLWWVILFLIGSSCLVSADDTAACRDVYQTLVRLESQVQDLDRLALAKRALVQADADSSLAVFNKLKPTWTAQTSKLQKLHPDDTVKVAQQMVHEQLEWAAGCVDVARAEAKRDDPSADPDRVNAYIGQGHEKANTGRTAYLKHKKELARRLKL